MQSIGLDFGFIGSKWGPSQINGSSGGVVTFSFGSSNFEGQRAQFDSFMTELDYQNEIIESFAAWEDVAAIRFSLVSDSPEVDIRVGWLEGDGSGGKLGDAFLPFSGPLESCVVRLDKDEDWFLGGNATLPQPDFSYVATHEIGHALGLDHSDAENSLMALVYDGSFFDLQSDDIAGVQALYGPSNVTKIDVHRFMKGGLEGHFFTADNSERNVVINATEFKTEGVAFEVISTESVRVEGSIPIYRFFNPAQGTHFYTANEQEKIFLQSIDPFILEGVVFRAFDQDTASTIPVYRFFNAETGTHFLTANEIEKETVLTLDSFVSEGIAFYAYADTIVPSSAVEIA